MQRALKKFVEKVIGRCSPHSVELSVAKLHSSIAETSRGGDTKVILSPLLAAAIKSKHPTVHLTRDRLRKTANPLRKSSDPDNFESKSKESREVTNTLKKLPSSEREKLFDELRSAGKADVYHYSCMIGLCSDSIAAEKLLKEMLDSGVRPNIVTYNVVMRKLVEDGKLFRAKKLLQDLRESGPHPDQHTFCTLVNGLSRAGRHKCAQQVYQQLCQEPFELDIPSYNIGISLYCRSGQHALAEEMIAYMLDRGVQPNNSTYTTLISSYGHAGKPDDAMRIFKSMKTTRDVAAYNALIHALTINNRIPEAENIAREKMGILLRRDTAALPNTHRPQTPTDSSEAAATRQSLTGSLPSLKKRTSPSQAASPPTSRQTTESTLSAHAQRVQPSTATQSSQATTLSASDAASAAPSDDPAGGASRPAGAPAAGAIAFTGDVSTVTSLVDAYGRNGRLEDARTAFRSLARLGLRPNVQAYTALISACAFNGRLDEAEHHYVEMVEQGVAPNERTMRVLIDACEAAGDGLAAMDWLWEARRRGVKPYSTFVTVERGGASGAGAAAGAVPAAAGGRTTVKIDLHGMSALSSTVAVRYALTSSRVNPRTTEVVIVTGQGRHSPNGPVVGPAVVKYLEEEGFHYSHVRGNHGRLVLEPAPGAAPTVVLCWLLVGLMWAVGCLAAGAWADNFRRRSMEANRAVESERFREELRRGLARHAWQNRTHAELAAAATAAAAAAEGEEPAAVRARRG